MPPWAVVSAALAPVAMVGGWTVAAALQPDFDPIRETISALAAGSARQPSVMTAGLAVTGVCHVVTAAGLRPAPLAGRALLALGGVGTAAVAALPVDTAAHPHGVAAGVAFVALSLWPAAAWRRPRRACPGTTAGDASCTSAPSPGPLVPAVGLTAAASLLALLALFVLELSRSTPTDGALTGITERLLAGAQTLWPLVVVLWLRRVGWARPA